MESRWLPMPHARCELLTDGEAFIGLGAIEIGATRVRSGRLPLAPYSQTFSGLELSSLRLRGVAECDGEVRIEPVAGFSPLPVQLMRDHSFDPIHDTGDWDERRVAGTGERAPEADRGRQVPRPWQEPDQLRLEPVRAREERHPHRCQRWARA